MMVYTRNFIGGRWREPLGNLVCEVRSPFNGEPVGVAPLASLSDVDLAVQVARQAIDQGVWSAFPFSRRLDVAERFLSSYIERLPALLQLVTRENAIPLRFNASLGEDLAARAAAHLRAARSARGTEADQTLLRRPAGLVAAIPAWNAPQSMAIGWLIPALLAGCTVILALNPITALDGQVIGELMMEAGLPDGLLSILVTGKEAARHLAGHPGVDRVALSSADEDGQNLAAVASSRSKQLILETARRSAAIILPDVEIALVVEGLREASLFASGQWHARQDRFFVPRHRYAELVAALCHTTAVLRLGDPLAPDTDIGPLISHRQRAAVMQALARGVAEGAELVSGGAPVELCDAIGAFLQPAVLSNVLDEMSVTRQTMLGPVILVMPYDEIDQAIQMSNAGGYGATTSVWTSEPELARMMADRLHAQVVAINGTGAAPGGTLNGIGRMHGMRGLDEFVEWQTLLM